MYAAFNRGDLEAAVAALVPKIEWTPLISGFAKRDYAA
jgi:hypothetical protein